MKRATVVLLVAAVWLATGMAHAQLNMDISCTGVNCGAAPANPWGLAYAYELRNIGAGPVQITSFQVGTDDVVFGNYANWMMPGGWVSAIGPGMLPTDQMLVPHGGPPGAPAFLTAGTITFSGPAILLGPGATQWFGFNNSKPAEDVEWIATDPLGMQAGTNWNAPIAGPMGVFTQGPVHAPVPEPGAIIALLSGGLMLVPLAWWARKRRKLAAAAR